MGPSNQKRFVITIARCLVAVAVSVSVGGLAAVPASADGPSPAIATNGYVRVVDDTGALSLEVPAS